MNPTLMNPASVSLFASLSAAKVETEPYSHWLLDKVLAPATHAALLDLPIAVPEISDHDGTRECNNSLRRYFNPETCGQFPVCGDVVAALRDPAIIESLQKTCGVDLTPGRLRIEYTQDSDGFWLEPHTDIGVKLFTMLVYLSEEPDLADAGTDIFDDSLALVKSVPFAANCGLIFIPGRNTWHGFNKRPIRGLRRSLIVNYVAPAWRERWQLS